MSNDILLGASVPYPDRYDPSVLEPIPRAHSRERLPWEDAAAMFYGEDIWTAYELSWLNMKGKPVVTLAEFRFPASSLNIIESKSFKYYLNSLNQQAYRDHAAVKTCLIDDLTKACGVAVDVRFYSPDEGVPGAAFSGECVDAIDVAIAVYSPDRSLLSTGPGEQKNKQLFSHLLKSNCPVTGQPDWASVWIEYSGKEILPAAFLQYIVSFRQHQDFHENCVERIYCDIWQQCQPEYLSVYARYTRRGGLDINPFRSSKKQGVPRFRSVRQ